MTNEEIKSLLADEESKKKFFEGLITFKGVHYFEAAFILGAEDDYIFLPIDENIIQKVKQYFFANKAFYRFKSLNSKTQLALPIDLYRELHFICKETNLEEFETYLGVIVAIASTEKLGTKGKKSTTETNIQNLREILQPKSTQNENSIIQKIHKGYFLSEFSLEFIDLETQSPASITFKGDEFIDHDIQMILTPLLMKLIHIYDDHITKKTNLNTNILFCHSFYNFINNETPYSYSSSNVLKADILRLFIKVYNLAGYEFKGYKAKLDEKDELDIAETWLKSSTN